MNTYQELNRWKLALCIATTICLSTVAQAAPLTPTTYAINHLLTVKEIPQGAKKVRIWFWMPQDDAAQKILDFAISEAPPGYKITRDPTYGSQYLYCEVNNPTRNNVSLATNFILSRHPISMALDAERSGALTPLHQQTFSSYLRQDTAPVGVNAPLATLDNIAALTAVKHQTFSGYLGWDTPYMEVDAQVIKQANEICGQETNVIRQARRIYDYVLDHADHYSKGETAPKPSKIGSVAYCRINGGGSCTDMHSLFSALARARGIPTRLYFGSRLQAKNEGKEVDPGYRCSVEFFAPNYGWVPVDVAAGDTNPDKRDFYFGGLDERRVLFNEGRNFDLAPKQDGPRINLFIGAYVEIDGKPHTSWDRLMKFTEVKPVSIKGGQAHVSDGTRVSDATIATQ